MTVISALEQLNRIPVSALQRRAAINECLANGGIGTVRLFPLDRSIIAAQSPVFTDVVTLLISVDPLTLVLLMTSGMPLVPTINGIVTPTRRQSSDTQTTLNYVPNYSYYGALLPRYTDRWL